MPRPSFEKLIVVTRRTRLQDIDAKFGTRDQARFVFRQQAMARAPMPTRRGAAQALPPDEFANYEAEHAVYMGALEVLLDALQFGLKVQVVDRSLVPSLLFAPDDLVVTVGQDGLVANVAKYVGGQPIVAINPDPARFDGVLLPFKVEQAADAVRRVLEGRARTRTVTLAEATLDDGQRLRAFNDLFVGASTHISARYRLRHGGREESHSSSGVIVSTGAGSTGWLSSIFNMVGGMGAAVERPAMAWEDPRLAFVVREPFASRTSQATLVHGLVEAGSELVIESAMPQGGVIFSDGVEADFLEFKAGTRATIRAASQGARLVTG